MATYSIKNISPTAVVWSSQTIQPNEAIDINYENLYDKTTDLGISQDAINVSTLAQEDKILLCIDDVASTKAETLEFIRELHNKNSVLEIPTKFLPSKHSYNWEKVGTKLSYLGDVGVGTNNPIEKFFVNSVSGDARIGLNAPTGSDTEIKFFNNGSVEYTIGHDDGTNNFVIGTANVDTPLLSINKTGNIGFGYASPNSKLEVNGGSDDSEVFRGRSDGGNGNNARFTLKAFASGGTYGGGFKIQTRDSSNVFQDRLTIDSTGNVDIGGHNVVTESPHFTDGLVSYSSDITHSNFTGHSSLQYSVSKTGLLEFYGYCYASSLSNSTIYQLNTGNDLPVNLRPLESKYFSVQCWSSTQTRTLLMEIKANGKIYLYSSDQGSGWSGTINIGMSFSYSLQ